MSGCSNIINQLQSDICFIKNNKGLTGPSGPTGPRGNIGATGPMGPSNIPSDILSKLQNATSQISFRLGPNNTRYSGSGFYYYDTNADLVNGYFITAAHCVMEITETGIYYKTTAAYIQNPITTKWITVNVNNIYVDGVADIALIRTGIDFTNYPQYCLKLNTGIVNAGDVCYVVGNPGGIDEDSISSGCVRDPNYCDPDGYQITNSIYINAPGIGGNSGGPIVNKNGDVIGIYTFGLGEGVECFGGGSNQSVLSSTLPVLKQNSDNKSKLYLGLHWVIFSPFSINLFYPNQTSFDTNGVIMYDINSLSPFFGILNKNNLLLKCIVNNTTIEFGNKNNQRTPGVLLYYPVGTTITIYYKKLNDNTVYTTNVQLNKTYANVPNTLDGPLQSGFSQNDDTRKKNKNINNNLVKCNQNEVKLFK